MFTLYVQFSSNFGINVYLVQFEHPLGDLPVVVVLAHQPLPALVEPGLHLGEYHDLLVLGQVGRRGRVGPVGQRVLDHDAAVPRVEAVLGHARQAPLAVRGPLEDGVLDWNRYCNGKL